MNDEPNLPVITETPGTEIPDVPPEPATSRRRPFRAFGRMMGTLVVTGLTLLMLGTFVAVGIIYYYSRDLPSYDQLATYDPPIVTRLYANDGRLLAEYATEKRVYVPLSVVPPLVREAFLSAEDRNFYSHTGVDLVGILRALRDNVQNMQGGKNLSGGSTITQQVVKNFLLSNEQSIARKVREAILAFRITQAYSKDRILELYLNQIYLGQGCYGVTAAALNYFNKSLEDLTVEEAAFLAALPKAPSNYDPRRHYDRAKDRRDWVLGRMMEDGHLTIQQTLEAQAKPITTRMRAAEEVTRADFFAEEVRRQLVALYGGDVLYKGGLWVKTTLDPRLQAAADKALRLALYEYDRKRGWRGPVTRVNLKGDWKKTLADWPKDDVPVVQGQTLAVVLKLDKEGAAIGFTEGAVGRIPPSELAWAKQLSRGVAPLAVGDVIVAEPLEGEAAKKAGKDAYALIQVPLVNGALVAMDPHTGRVLAMSGGYSQSRSEFNRATQAKRQPGSAFKPFVYLTALERGFTPASIILDGPVTLSQGAGMPAWTPKNYGGDFLGPVTLRTGLEKSRNAMTVRIAVALGIQRVMETAKRFGIYDEPPRNFSIVLGAVETTLTRLTTAYSSIVNGGYKVTPSIIERIDDRNGKTIFRRDNRPCPTCKLEGDGLDALPVPPSLPDVRPRILDERVSYQMVSLLEGVVQRGTATRARVLGRPVAGKTGTTNDSKDVWFVGFTPDLVAGIYVGYDAPKSLGARETGGSTALPGFIAFMKEALKDTPPTPFRIPKGVQLARIGSGSGQVPLPGERSVLEAFVVGDPIFHPGEENKENAEVLGDDKNPEDPVLLPPLGGQNTAPTVGTGGLY